MFLHVDLGVGGAYVMTLTYCLPAGRCGLLTDRREAVSTDGEMHARARLTAVALCSLNCAVVILMSRQLLF